MARYRELTLRERGALGPFYAISTLAWLKVTG